LFIVDFQQITHLLGRIPLIFKKQRLNREIGGGFPLK